MYVLKDLGQTWSCTPMQNLLDLVSVFRSQLNDYLFGHLLRLVEKPESFQRRWGFWSKSKPTVSLKYIWKQENRLIYSLTSVKDKLTIKIGWNITYTPKLETNMFISLGTVKLVAVGEIEFILLHWWEKALPLGYPWVSYILV